MYNIAKVAKGEILLFFNDVFDALCKVWSPISCVEIHMLMIQLAADSELSVKNGAELLDRLVKDIVSESAATYVSVLQSPEKAVADPGSGVDSTEASLDLPTAFSLTKFIPLLKERIHVINPFTRTFLVSWVTLLDTIPDLELVFYLPAFLGGLFRFLSDPNRDVHVATQGALERFLSEIKRIARIKRGIAESRKTHSEGRQKPSNSSDSASVHTEQSTLNEKLDDANIDAGSGPLNDAQSGAGDGDWVPGQDVQVDHPKVLEILVTFLDSSSGSKALRPPVRLNTFLTLLQRKKSNSLPSAGLTASLKYVRKISSHLCHGYCRKSSPQWPAVQIKSGRLPTASTTL